MIKKKTENFQNPISENYDPPISHKLFNYFINFLPIIYLFIIFLFPKVGLIINSISLVYWLYIFYIHGIIGRIETRFLAYLFIMPIVIIVIILQIMLLFIVFPGKKAETKAETKDND